LIYINDIDEGVTSGLLKFADDSKIFGVVASKDDVRNLQGDLKNLCRWSTNWLTLFNVEKCKVKHIGYNNKRENYKMDGKNLDEVDGEQDLGVMKQSNLKWNRQCTKVVKTANEF
jgi:ribonucleases P/MRP protein subunit RPP40